MEIGGFYVREKLGERVRGNNGRHNDKPALFDGQLNHAVLLEADLFRESLGDSERQAVSPLLNARFHKASVETMSLRGVLCAGQGRWTVATISNFSSLSASISADRWMPL